MKIVCFLLTVKTLKIKNKFFTYKIRCQFLEEKKNFASLEYVPTVVKL